MALSVDAGVFYRSCGPVQYISNRGFDQIFFSKISIEIANEI